MMSVLQVEMVSILICKFCCRLSNTAAIIFIKIFGPAQLLKSSYSASGKLGICRHDPMSVAVKKLRKYNRWVCPQVNISLVFSLGGSITHIVDALNHYWENYIFTLFTNYTSPLISPKHTTRSFIDIHKCIPRNEQNSILATDIYSYVNNT